MLAARQTSKSVEQCSMECVRGTRRQATVKQIIAGPVTSIKLIEQRVQRGLTALDECLELAIPLDSHIIIEAKERQNMTTQRMRGGIYPDLLKEETTIIQR